uniref:Uncharacterized protein n=1 Tax=Rhizophora mucronata TaxID=61149 RepID=A0A2P2N232_RHIMU
MLYTLQVVMAISCLMCFTLQFFNIFASLVSLF